MSILDQVTALQTQLTPPTPTPPAPVLGEAVVLREALPSALRARLTDRTNLQERAAAEQAVLEFVLAEMAEPDLLAAQQLAATILEQEREGVPLLGGKKEAPTSAKELDLEQVPYDEVRVPTGWQVEQMLGLKNKTWTVWRKPKFRRGKLSAVVSPDLKPNGRWTRKWKWWVEQPADTRVTKADYNDEADWLVSGVVRNVTQAFREAWSALRDQRKRLGQGAEPGDEQDESVDEAEGARHVPDSADAGVADIILDQLGGERRLRAMLGMTWLDKQPKALTFAWPSKQAAKGNLVTITLDPDDTYSVEFFKAKLDKIGKSVVGVAEKKSVKQVDGIYADGLADLFERQTGYYLTLAPRKTEDKAGAAELTKGQQAALAQTKKDLAKVGLALEPVAGGGWKVVPLTEGMRLELPEVAFVREGSAEWKRMWAELAKHPLNKGLDEPEVADNAEYGEAWQYMGSYNGFHEFRHRVHPTTGKREIVHIKISKQAKTYLEAMHSQAGQLQEGARGANVAFNCSSAYRYLRETFTEGEQTLNTLIAARVKAALPGDYDVKVLTDIVQSEDRVTAEVGVSVKLAGELNEKLWDKTGDEFDAALRECGISDQSEIVRERWGWKWDGEIDLLHAGR